MTLARPLLCPLAVLPPYVGGNVRFVSDVFHALSPTADTAADFSIATTAGLVSGTRHCSNEPSHAPDENSSRIPSINTSGSAAVAPLLFSFSFWGSLDFFELLQDLDRGSWEVLLPEGSSLGGESHSSPRRLSVSKPLRCCPELYQSSFNLADRIYLKISAGYFHHALALILTVTRQWHPGSRWSAKVAYFFAATDYGSTFYFYQSGFDPAYSKHSVGLVMMGLAIKSALEEGAAEYDLLHGDEEYKFHWAPDHRELARLEVYPPHARARIYRRAIDFNRAARRMARRMLNKI
jgi:hypothetical protein